MKKKLSLSIQVFIIYVFSLYVSVPNRLQRDNDLVKAAPLSDLAKVLQLR